MKIAFLNIYNGKIERGSEVFVEELAEKLAENHEVFVFQTGKAGNRKYKTIRIPGIPYLKRQGFCLLEKLLGSFIFDEIYHLVVLVFTLICLPYLWREKFDWIIPVNGRWQVIICRFLRFMRGSKILISGHAGVGFDDKWNILVGSPDIFVPLTLTALSWAKKFYPGGKIAYIPNGIDTDKFKSCITEKKLPLKKPIVLCVAALLPYKRVELLIKAVSQLKSVSLLVIGDGPLRKRIVNLGNELLQNRFLLISYVPHEEIVSYYKSVQLFSLPSEQNEAFGLVYLEAMAANLPIVAPNDINRREIVGKAGYLGELTNVDVYADLLDKALHTDFGDEPKNQAEKFSWEKIAKKYEEVFAEN